MSSKSTHNRHRVKWATDPRTGDEVPGVRFHSDAGYHIYIGTGRSRKRQGFGKTVKGLDLAKHAYAETLRTTEDEDWDNRPQSHEGYMLERLIRDNPARAAEVLSPDAMFGYDPRQPQPEQTKKQKQGKTLRDCLAVWHEWIADERKTTNGKDTTAKFRKLIRIIGNVPVADLNSQHFLAWQQWIKRQMAARKWSVRTTKGYHSAITRVLEFAARKYEDWGFPDGLTKWANDWKLDQENKKPYRPDRKSKMRMPSAEFRRCLDCVENWGTVDVENMPKTTQQDKGKRRRAKDKPRDALQWSLMLRLLVQCSLDPIDIERMQFQNFRLKGKLPHLDLPRTKMERKTGFAIPRLIPLLPTTVQAIKAWKEHSGISTGLVFRSSNRERYRSRSIQKRFAGIATDADAEGWSLKHLRNVGPTLGKIHKLSTDERDALLGHITNGSHADYEDETEIGAEFLIAAVNLIGKEYLNDAIPDAGQSLTSDE